MLRKYLIPGVTAISFAIAATIGPGGSSDTHADASLDSEEVIFMGLINAYRADHQLGPLLIDSSIQNAAEWMSTDMGEKDYFSHTDSLGRSPWDRMCLFGYCYNTWKGENIAAGYVTGEDVFEGWRGSPGHNANMLGEHYRVMGLARVHTDGSTFGWYWTNDFGGEVVDASPPPAPTNTPEPTSTPGQTQSASSTPAPTVTPTSTPAPTLTNTPTPNPTKTPTPTPTESPTATHSPKYAADVDCDSKVTGGDSLTVLRFIAEVDPASNDCPGVGTQSESSGSGARFHGDMDCDGAVGTYDALLILRFSAGDESAVPDSCN